MKVWVVIIMMYSGSETDDTHIYEVQVFKTKEAKDKFITEFQSWNHWGVKEIYDEKKEIKE